MKTRTTQLRVKILSLAAEAKIIRSEENRALGRAPDRLTIGAPITGVLHQKPLRFRWARTGKVPDVVLYRDLRVHRCGVVRKAARVALLAYAMVREVPYARVEARTLSAPDFAEVRKVAERFGAVCEPEEDALAWRDRLQAQTASFVSWIAAAEAHLEEIRQADEQAA